MGATGVGLAVGLLLAAQGPLAMRIPPADPAKYKPVRDAKDWANPYLVVRPGGVEVISKSLPEGRKVVSVKEVEQTLVGLPADAWPYGRVAAVQEIGIRSDGDDKPIERNKAALKEALEKLKVKIEWWPGA